MILRRAPDFWFSHRCGNSWPAALGPSGRGASSPLLDRLAQEVVLTMSSRFPMSGSRATSTGCRAWHGCFRDQVPR
jgi:hypothetical protein